MDAKTYQEEAHRTVSPLESFNENCYHMLFGLATEVGELTDLYKKYMAYGKEFEPKDIRNEMGDILWYLANLATLEGLTLEEIMEANIQKLRVRYPYKFEANLAINKDEKAEEAAIEDEQDTFIGSQVFISPQ